MSDCVFCGIVGKTVPAEIVFEDEQAVAFKDLNPLAPVHLLVIPKQHHPDLDTLSDPVLMNHLITIAKNLGAEHSAELGYRVLVNSGRQAEVSHVHVHLLGGLRSDEPLKTPGGDVT